MTAAPTLKVNALGSTYVAVSAVCPGAYNLGYKLSRAHQEATVTLSPLCKQYSTL